MGSSGALTSPLIFVGGGGKKPITIRMGGELDFLGFGTLYPRIYK